MPNSRGGVIVVLVAIEVLIAGYAIALMHGTGTGTGWSVDAASLHRVSFHAHPNAPLAAGTTPHIWISDPDSRVVVTTSSDGLVHVTDGTSVGGFVYGTAGELPQLQITRTADGVRVERASSSNRGFLSFGSIDQRVEIAVPAGSSLEIARSSGADVSDLTGDVNVLSQDGSIHARGISAKNVTLVSHDGRVILDGIAAANLVATTDDGRIRANGLQLTGDAPNGRIHSGDGSVSVHFADAGNLNVRSQTSDGHIVVNGRSTHSDNDAVEETSTLGNPAGSLDVSTQDGTITMTTNGVQ